MTVYRIWQVTLRPLNLKQLRCKRLWYRVGDHRSHNGVDTLLLTRDSFSKDKTMSQWVKFAVLRDKKHQLILSICPSPGGQSYQVPVAVGSWQVYCGISGRVRKVVQTPRSSKKKYLRFDQHLKLLGMEVLSWFSIILRSISLLDFALQVTKYITHVCSQYT